jgi:hypothetical protein
MITQLPDQGGSARQAALLIRQSRAATRFEVTVLSSGEDQDQVRSGPALKQLGVLPVTRRLGEAAPPRAPPACESMPPRSGDGRAVHARPCFAQPPFAQLECRLAGARSVRALTSAVGAPLG